ncbi:MAG: HEAT repeat domain-containing protein [Candidatus Eisenbacteria bacterium]
MMAGKRSGRMRVVGVGMVVILMPAWVLFPVFAQESAKTPDGQAKAEEMPGIEDLAKVRAIVDRLQACLPGSRPGGDGMGPDAGTRERYDATDAVRDIRAMGLVGVRALATLVEPERDPKRLELEVLLLGELGDPAGTPALTGLLARPSAHLQCLVLRALARYGDPGAAPPVRGLLVSEDDRVRSHAADAYLAIRKRDPEADLVKPLGDVMTGAGVTTEAQQDLVRLLGLLADLRAVEVVVGQTYSEDRGVRKEAIRALGRLPDERSIQRLQQIALEEEDASSRRWAVISLGEIGWADAVPVLIRALSDEDAGVRDKALRVLKALTGCPFGPEPGPWGVWWEGQVRRVQDLAERLESDSPGEVRIAIRGLGQVRVWRAFAVERVLPYLRNDDFRIRREAAQSLGSLNAWGAVAELVELLEDHDAGVRDAAWAALRRITGQSLSADAEEWRNWLGGG